MENAASEIRTIRLYRESLEECNKDNGQNCHLQEGQLQNGRKRYFATDYFDMLITEEKGLDDTFRSVMNLTYDEVDETEENKISVQSYTLYFSEEMYRRYEKDDVSHNRKPPFSDQNDMGFLSIIQVHITPEILRRMKNEAKGPDGIVLEQFIDDLYDILGHYNKREIVYRVYHVLSAGDLAVVVKSRYPQISFEISSAIRKRVAGRKSGNDLRPSPWALYKTYTLLALEENKDLEEEPDHKNAHFVLRGCYSCLYWANKDEIDQFLEENGFQQLDGISGLNGRYDFSIELSEAEFYLLYPEIAAYKAGRKKTGGSSDLWKEVEFPKVKYLIFLLERGYLSYINERYFPAVNGIGEEQGVGKKEKQFVSRFVLLDEERLEMRTLKCKNAEELKRLLVKYEEMKGYLPAFEGTYQNLGQYFELLRKQIVSCYELNQQPDTRVYACGFIEQLETVLDSFDIYQELCRSVKNRGTKMELINLMVENVREAVHAVDSYMEYIRNNNLQSLQTPNYNIESSMGMEKILLPYSEYLCQFMWYYQKRRGEAGALRTYLPIVVPDLHKIDICVETLFPEGYGENWLEEQSLRKGKGDRFLLIIDSPTLAELGDMPIFMAMLFHEVAHQFRYEDRKIRNELVEEMFINEYAMGISFNIAEDVKQQCGLHQELNKLIGLLNSVLQCTQAEYLSQSPVHHEPPSDNAGNTGKARIY